MVCGTEHILTCEFEGRWSSKCRRPSGDGGTHGGGHCGLRCWVPSFSKIDNEIGSTAGVGEEILQSHWTRAKGMSLKVDIGR